MALTPAPQTRQTGLSLVEVLVAMTIGLVILMAIISLLATSTRSRQELDQSGQMTENGQYAIQTLHEELRHAGFFGHYYANGLTAPASLPDPCVSSDASALLAAMALPLQGYHAPDQTTRADLATSTCATTLLGNANLKPGSDILVVRRADTAILSGTPTRGEVYLQANVTTAAIQFGSATANVPTTTADGGPVTLTQRNGAVISPANIRKLHVRTYFIAPCASGSGAFGVCTTSDDTTPTLKRLDLTASGGTPTLTITPLAEGIEFMKFTYGLDDTPPDTDPATGLTGDGFPDSWKNAGELTASTWGSVVAVQVNLLARALESSREHVDDKIYQVGPLAISAPGDGYRRHIFSIETRPVNLAGPRSMR
nr:Type IV pilus assembly protein PilW [uncultured bacterium]